MINKVSSRSIKWSFRKSTLSGGPDTFSEELATPPKTINLSHLSSYRGHLTGKDQIIKNQFILINQLYS